MKEAMKYMGWRQVGEIECAKDGLNREDVCR